MTSIPITHTERRRTVRKQPTLLDIMKDLGSMCLMLTYISGIVLMLVCGLAYPFVG